MEEIWKDIEGLEGQYMLSDTGKVKSLNYHNTGKEGLLKPLKVDKYGHQQVSLKKDGKQKKYYINRLVAYHFQEICGEWFEDCVVDHIDRNPTNNSAYNLKVCSQKENQNNPNSIAFMKKAQKTKAVEQYFNKELVQSFSGIREASKITGIDKGHICACCKGKQKTAGGYIWKYSA